MAELKSGLYRPREVEREVEKYWKEKNVYQAVRKKTTAGQNYYFLDGPPYTSGSVHIGTAWNKILKDMYIRYRRMQGYNVRDQPGYDMHGLPIEVLVEKDMGITNKKEIEKIGINKFVRKCKKFATNNMKKMTKQFRRLGVWMDWDNPYTTITNEYIEAAWWALKKAHEKGLLSEAERVIPWCPRCETALAEAEIKYEEEEDYSIYVKFPIIEEKNHYILIWTTTPWTIPGNLAVAVHPEYVYVKVKVGDETIITLEDTHEDVLKEAGIDDYSVIERLGGSQLVGKKYCHPLTGAGIKTITAKWAHSVLLYDGVERDKSGVVHIAPGHGPEDFELGQEYGLPPFCPVDESGAMTAEAGKYAGMSTTEASEAVLRDLEKSGLLLSKGTVIHRYGHCWRCRTKIIYRTTKQWFIRVEEIKDKLLAEIEKVRWTPEWAGSARQKNWVENAKDWCITRQRYWGIPFPVWKCDNCASILVIGSAAELKKLTRRKKLADLHRPWIDKVKIKCKKCGKKMSRLPDVLDVWFDSAVCSWASLRYPMDDKEFKKWWPANWIVEAHDQTRGWFYSQLCASVIAFGRSPYESVLMHGFALDENGRPMSKSLGNVIDPMEIVDKYGVDAFRLYLLHASAPWEDLPFSVEGVKNAHRILNILWNCFIFSHTYMALDSFKPDYSVLQNTSIMESADLWILSRLENTKTLYSQGLENYNIHKAMRTLENFIVEDFSRWYIRMVKDRVWTEEQSEKKLATYNVLHYVLDELAKLLAPVTPYIAEKIHLSLGNERSVHLSSWPAVNEKFIDNKLEFYMGVAREAVETIAYGRQKIGRGLRWPIARAVFIAKSNDVADAIENMAKIVKKQANIKAITVVRPDEQWDEMRLKIKPNMHAIGPVFRQWAGKIARLLQMADARKVKSAIEKGEYSIGIEGQRLKVTPDMVEFEYSVPEHYQGFDFQHGKLYLDTRMNNELMGEGFAREIIRRIQQMRKDVDMNVEDYIECQISASDRVAELIAPYAEWIANETRAELLEIVDEITLEGYIVDWKIADEAVKISIVQVVIEYEEEAEKERAKTEEILPPTPERRPEHVAASADVVGEAVEVAKVGAKVGEAVEAGKEAEKGAAVCPLCGYTISEGAKVCPRCGTKLGEEFEPKMTELKDGFTYLYIGSIDKAYETYKREAELRGKSLCISRDPPSKLEKTHGIRGNVIWLTDFDAENTVRPRDLEKLNLVVEQFASENEGGIIMLDGLEYLCINNNFVTVLKLLQSIRDIVAIRKVVFLIPIMKGAFEEHQVNMLEREVDGVLTD